MTVANRHQCTHCFTENDENTKVCLGCGATRRKPASGNWTSYREGRRNDIILGGLGLMIFASCVSTIFFLVALAGSNQSRLIQTPTTRSSSYGTCSINSSTWPEC
jgi:hypothetical protein